MSKIGKKPIQVPGGVEIKVDGSSVFVKGPKGELKRDFDKSVNIAVADGRVVVSLIHNTEDKRNLAIWGLTRALLANMLKGVSEGFEKNLTFEGVGYKAAVKGEELELNLGFSHSISIKTPVGIIFKVEKNVIRISGINNEQVGQIAAEIKSKRPPEPYKGKGIRYAGEVIRRKAGKKAATAA